MNNEIPKEILSAAVGMLSPWCPDLTVERLEASIGYTPEDVSSEKMYTRKETAAELGDVSLRTVDRCIKDGSLPKRNIRRSVRIPASAIADFLQGKNNRGVKTVKLQPEPARIKHGKA